MILAVAMMFAPWCAVTTDDLTTIHRVEMEGIPVLDYTTADHATAVCGAHVKLLDMGWRNLRTRGTKARRCAECRARLSLSRRRCPCPTPHTVTST